MTEAEAAPKTLLKPRHVDWFPLLEMRYEEGRGRFLVAAQPIPMGETVCMSLPYCRAVTNSVKRMVCSHCYKASTNRLPLQCTRCQEVSFCSSECRDKEMQQHMPYECNAFKKMNRTRGRDKLDLDDVRVIINMLNKRYFEKKRNSYSAEVTETNTEATEEQSATTVHVQEDRISTGLNDSLSHATSHVDTIGSAPKGSLIQDVECTEHAERDHITPVTQGPATDIIVDELCFEDVANLVGDADMLPNAVERKVFEEAAAFLLRIVDDPLKEGLDQDSVKGLFLKSRFNRFGKWSKKGTAMGFGVFPYVSYFNHSCIPNLRRYQGDDFGLLQIRAIRPIEAGEELCISYTDLHLTTDDRRMVLRDYFGFTCMCPRCTDTTEASDKFVMEKSCPSRFCQELLLPLKEYDCKVLHCRHCGIINHKHRPKT